MWWFCVLLFATASGRPDETQRPAYVSSDAAASAHSSKDDWPGTQLNSHYNPNSINGQECMQPGAMSKVVQGDVYYDCVCAPNDRGSLVLKCSPCDRCSRRNSPSNLPNVISVKQVIPERSEKVPYHFKPVPSPLVAVPSPTVPIPPSFNPSPSSPILVPSAPIPGSSPPISVPSSPIPMPSAPVPVPSPPVHIPSPPDNQYIAGSYGHWMVPESGLSIFNHAPVPLPFKPVSYSPIPVPSPSNPVPSPPVPIPSPFKPLPSSPVPVPSPSDPIPVPPASAPVSFPLVPIQSPSLPLPFSFGNQFISGSDGHLMIPASSTSVFTPVPVPSAFNYVPYSPLPVPSPPIPVPSPPIAMPSPIGSNSSPFNPVPFSPVPSQSVPVPPRPVPVPSPAVFTPSPTRNWYISGYHFLPVTGIPGSTGINKFVDGRTSADADATSNAEP